MSNTSTHSSLSKIFQLSVYQYLTLSFSLLSLFNLANIISELQKTFVGGQYYAWPTMSLSNF